MSSLKYFALSILILSLLVLPSTSSSHSQENSLNTSQSAKPQGPVPRAKFMKTSKPISNRYIVVLDDDIVPDNLPLEARRERVAAIANSHAQSHGGVVGYIYETALKGYAIELPNEAVAIAISKLPQVKWVEEVSLGEANQAPPSPQPIPPWGLDSMDSGLPAPSPYPTTGLTNGSYSYGANGTGVSAYVVDSGINTAHVEFLTPFTSRAVQAADCFTFLNCVSGQQTTYFNQQACVSPMPNSTNNDCHGHGTLVAGVLGGNTYGVAKNVTIRAVKVGFNSFLGGYPLDATIAGVNWVTGNHQASPSIPAVANMSLAFATSLGLETAITNSQAAGVTWVASAGNSNTDARNQAPADVTDALTVGSVDWNGVRDPQSNWGIGVDLFAPGVSVVSAQSGNGVCLIWNGSNNSSCIVSGTSFAAPHVAGAVAMYLQGRPAISFCGGVPIQGQAPATANVSTCPDRVARFIKANARLDLLSNINGTIFINGVPVTVPSPNRFLTTTSIPAPANPIENNRFFVWSQYTDFLNREPDTTGFNNWTSNLNSCGSDWTCLNNQRIHTVRGMIESAEFRQGKPALSNPTSTDQYNREYIRQLYLCLLRREPDTNGFNTYVSELNSTGDYDHAVHGFINGSEYRLRFGPN